MGELECAEPEQVLRLTPRERDVLALVAQGLTSKQAARRLGLSTRTVDNHLQAAMRRARLPSRTVLALQAVQRGLL